MVGLMSHGAATLHALCAGARQAHLGHDAGAAGECLPDGGAHVPAVLAHAPEVHRQRFPLRPGAHLRPDTARR